MRNTLMLIAAALGFAATPVMAQETSGLPSLADMQRLVTQMRGQMFRTGAAVAGWNRGGANPDAELRRAGADRFYYRISKPSGDSVVILTDRPLASFAPAGWRVVDTYGDSASRAANPVVEFQALSDRSVVGLRAGSDRRGDVDCIDGIANAVLYERPEAQRSDEDATLPLLFRLVLLAGEGQTVCTRYEGNRETGWHGNSFTPDGHSLPELDEAAERITIIPAAPVERLVTFHRVPDATAPAA